MSHIYNIYNFYNLEAKFKKFLHSENISLVSLRNYLSDLRHFFGWLVSKKDLFKNHNFEAWITFISPEIIEKYKNEHLKSSLPSKTINRRLSTLRKFFYFCQLEKLLEKNPAKIVTNVSLTKNVDNIEKKDKREPASNTVDKKEAQKNNDKNQPAQTSPYKFIFRHRHLVIGVIVLFISLLVFFFINPFKKPIYQIQTVSASQPGKRYIAFSGKLINNLGKAITKKTDVIFRLYKHLDYLETNY